MMDYETIREQIKISMTVDQENYGPGAALLILPISGEFMLVPDDNGLYIPFWPEPGEETFSYATLDEAIAAIEENEKDEVMSVFFPQHPSPSSMPDDEEPDI